MWDYVDMKRDLRSDDMCGRGYLNRILTLVRPQIVDRLLISMSHMSESHLRLQEFERGRRYRPDYPYMLNCQISSESQLYLSASDVLVDKTGPFNDCFHFVYDRATG